MLKKTSDLYDLLNIKKEKESFDEDVDVLLNIVKNKTGIVLEKNSVFIKNGIVKIKTSSNNKFMMLLFINDINLQLNKYFDNKIILEL